MFDPIRPFNFEEENCKRLAARYSLGFHIHGSYLTTHAGWKSETREATEAEQALWDKFCTVEEFLPATLKEVEDCLPYHEGPFTVNPVDMVPILELGYKVFRPCAQREFLEIGLFGWIVNPKLEGITQVEKAPIYVSRHIPIGFYYEGDPIPEITHWKAPKIREIKTIPDEILHKVSFALKPFIQCG
jgi:hypothetical protein